MKVVFLQRFEKDIRRLRDATLLGRLKKSILALEEAHTLDAVPQIVAMTGHPNHYRIRIGDYRLGIELRDDAMFLVRFLHRREIYRIFP